MAYIKEYWTEKGKRAKQAQEHTRNMEKRYADLVDKSAKYTICYSPDFECKKDIIKEKPVQIIVDDIDSVSAIMKYHITENDRMAVLNFSSYKEAGGMFLKGSKAQEECLCHESFLYNVLSRNQVFYEWNNQHKNRSLYLNRALFSPNILFIKPDSKYPQKEIMKFCDVITCAAPNKSAAQKYQNVSDKENSKVLQSRIKFILDIAKENHIDTLILGAYGCGVFGQNPYEVADIFKTYLTTTHKYFKNVVFAIPNGKNNNLEAFRTVFDCFTGGIK